MRSRRKALWAREFGRAGVCWRGFEGIDDAEGMGGWRLPAVFSILGRLAKAIDICVLSARDSFECWSGGLVLPLVESVGLPRNEWDAVSGL